MSLMTYSGLATKVRAMESHFFTEAQFRTFSSLENVRSTAEYLRQQPAYQDFFSNLDDSQLHRGHIEQLLLLSKYRDFTKLYRFSSISQRHFLDIAFLHYEVDIIKRCLRNAMSHHKTELDLSMLRDFFEKHSHIDLMKLSETEDIDSFCGVLKDSIYEEPLSILLNQEHATVFDYELQFDLYYLSNIVKLLKKALSKQEQALLGQCFGCQLDLLNLQWIYRLKKYYGMSPETISKVLIPTAYRLKPEQTKGLLESPSLDDFRTRFAETYYGRLASSLDEIPDLESLSEQILDRIYDSIMRKHPYSIAILETYLYRKEQEIKRIITAIEGIRYGLDANAIYSHIAKTKRRNVP